MKHIKISRRNFLKGSAFITGSATGASLMVGANPELEAAPKAMPSASATRTTALAQCPYCGVGCGTIIQVENGKIVSMRPDKDHPTNAGLQCIKGLTAAEPIYVDRMEGDSYVRKDVWAEWNKPGHGDLDYVTKTKGSFDEEHFVRVPYAKASEMVAHKIAHLAKTYGGNSIGLYGSGQLTMEGQYLENLFMKGVLSSNTIEANARMCMTSAVTGYFATLGSDTPPLAYEDIELCDMIMHFGHNPREAHPIIFWRCADHKKKSNIPTVMVDPRNTGSQQGYADINPDNSVHVPILNGDISFLNSLAHVLLKDHPDVIDWEFMKAHTSGWKEYTDGVLKDYSPEQIQDRVGNEEVTPALIRRVAGMFADATRKRLARSKGEQEPQKVGVPGGGGYGGVIIMWGIGYNQHIHGQHNIISIVNLLTMTGNLAKPGCGPFSMTGQPNAMGERFTGGLTGRLPFNDRGLTPDLPDEKFRNRAWKDVPKDKYPYWLGLGVVYEHFHTAKSNRSPTTRRLVPEQYVEMHPEDAKALGIKDGDKVRLTTRRGHYEARAQVGTNSLVKPARNSVPRGYLFSPWNLSVADSADPKKNKWLVNGTSSRAWDPVSGQVDFKKLACRVEKV
jgi:nitrate reductase NapA